MTIKKPLYLLAGRAEGTMGCILEAVFRDIGKARPTIAYVGAASEDNRDFFRRMAGIIMRVKDCEIVPAFTYARHADTRKAVGIIESADAVFVSGGDVEAGMAVLERKSLTSLFPEMYEAGKLFFGVSAGSIMLSDRWVRWRNPDDDSTAELFPCLGLASFICDTHGEGDDWDELRAAVTLGPERVPGYGITSGACLKVYSDGSLEALAGSVAVYMRRGQAAEKQPDLMPLPGTTGL
jgi:peptidase E